MIEKIEVVKKDFVKNTEKYIIALFGKIEKLILYKFIKAFFKSFFFNLMKLFFFYQTKKF